MYFLNCRATMRRWMVINKRMVEFNRMAGPSIIRWVASPDGESPGFLGNHHQEAVALALVPGLSRENTSFAGIRIPPCSPQQARMTSFHLSQGAPPIRHYGYSTRTPLEEEHRFCAHSRTLEWIGRSAGAAS